MSENAVQTVTTNDDGQFVRTAIVLDRGAPAGASFDIIDGGKNLIARLNLFHHESGNVTIDLCKLDQFQAKHVTGYTNGQRNVVEFDTAGVIAVSLSRMPCVSID